MGKLEKRFVNSPGHSKKVSKRAERLLTLTDLSAGQQYLDVGTGNGAAPIHMAQTYGLQVTGVDVDVEQIELAQQSSVGMRHVRFMAVDGNHLPFEDESFDIVSAFRVTHHIPNWQAALAEMMRVLKSGGTFVYSDLAFPAWMTIFDTLLLAGRAGFPTHKGLQAIVEANHLTPVSLRREWMLYEGVFRKRAG